MVFAQPSGQVIPSIVNEAVSGFTAAATSFLASDFVAVSSDYYSLFLQLTINKVANAIPIIDFEKFMIIILELGFNIYFYKITVIFIRQFIKLCQICHLKYK